MSHFHLELEGIQLYDKYNIIECSLQAGSLITDPNICKKFDPK